MNKCVSSWETIYIEEEDFWSGETVTVGKNIFVGCEYEDVSLHSFKCVKCGHVGYYSGAGKLVETEGYSLDDAMSKIDREYKKVKPKIKKPKKKSS